MNLPIDIYKHLFTLKKFRLRHIINFTMVSEQLREISLSEENWFIIMDTKKILYDFVRKIFQSDYISYPFRKIRQMHPTDYRDCSFDHYRLF
jgi:hypothetical protein